MKPAAFVHVLGFAGALLGGLPADAAEMTDPLPTAQAHRRDPSVLTLKERSGGKAGDEQRVDDCKVPLEQRGDHRRPADCTKR